MSEVISNMVEKAKEILLQPHICGLCGEEYYTPPVGFTKNGDDFYICSKCDDALEKYHGTRAFFDDAL